MTRALRRRLARATAGRDAGVSLPELIITMALLALLTTVVLVLVTNVFGVFSRERAGTDSARTASVGMNELARVVRSGTTVRLVAQQPEVPVFVTAGPNVVEMYAYVDTSSSAPRPLRVRFEVDAQRRLVETRWTATSTKEPWTFAPKPTSTRIIAHDVQTAAATPMFSYLDAANKPFTIPASGSLTEADRSQVAAVRIRLTVQADTQGRADPVTLRNTVSIPNLGLSRNLQR